MKYRVTFASIVTYDVEVEAEGLAQAAALARGTSQNNNVITFDPEVILVELIDG